MLQCNQVNKDALRLESTVMTVEILWMSRALFLH